MDSTLYANLLAVVALFSSGFFSLAWLVGEHPAAPPSTAAAE